MALRKDGRAAAVGIDLGTTKSCVGVWKNNRIEIVPNCHGNRTTPSCVAFVGTEVLVGEPAVEQRNLNVEATVSWVKHLIGRKFVVPQHDVRLLVRHGGEEKRYSPEQISGFILSSMRQAVESYLGNEVKKAVVAVPVYFNDERRDATKAAAAMTGLEEIRIIDEPIAAAVAYGFNRGRSTGNIPRIKNVLVFDPGRGNLERVATADRRQQDRGHGDSRRRESRRRELRLQDDGALRPGLYFKRRYGNTTSSDILTNLRAMTKLKSASERAKRRLSFFSEAPVAIGHLHQGIDFQSSISRDKFEELNEENFSRCVDMLDRCFTTGTIGKDNVQEVVLVGGSTRISRIQNLVRDYFPGKELCMSINPDEVVAYGAAVWAANVEEVAAVPEPEVLLSLSLGVSGPGGIMVVVIPRETPIPTKKSTELYLPCYMEWLLLGFYEGERSMVADNSYIGGFTLEGHPLQRAYLPKLTVTFEVDAEGVLTVTTEMEGYENAIISTTEWGTRRRSLANIAEMVAVAEAQKVDDEKRMRKAQAELKALICNLRLLVAKEAKPFKLEAAGKAFMEDEIALATDWVRQNEGAEATDFEAMKQHLVDVWCHVCRQYCPPSISLLKLEPCFQHL